MEISGKTAFVTGAGSGIGLGIASALSQAGVKVMLCDIEDTALIKAVADLKLTNADVDGVRADVSLKGELQAAAATAIAALHYFGRFTHAAACCKSIFGSVGIAAADVIERRVRGWCCVGSG
jgi:NAD(P)-dependent dehydrogenase (short-subunit alcohol dehydrogenase family)